MFDNYKHAKMLERKFALVGVVFILAVLAILVGIQMLIFSAFYEADLPWFLIAQGVFWAIFSVIVSKIISAS